MEILLTVVVRLAIEGSYITKPTTVIIEPKVGEDLVELLKNEIDTIRMEGETNWNSRVISVSHCVLPE